MSTLNNEHASQEKWKQKTIEYAQKINAYVEKGLLHGWDKAGPEPEESKLEELVPHLLKAIKKANAGGCLSELREKWPLAYGPLLSQLKDNEQSIPVVALLNNGTIVARIGRNYQEGHIVEIKDTKINVVEGIDYFGYCPNKKYFAYTQADGISVTDGWLGSEVALLPYPKGTEDIPDGYEVKAFTTKPKPSKLIPFPDGQRVLFVSSEGIFVLTSEKAIRIHPSTDDMKEHFKWSKEEYPEDELRMSIDMEHGAVSPKGDLIAIGSQDSTHLVFNDKYELIGDIGNQSSYPHFAIFSKDSEMIAFNSCHFYNGVTIGVPTKLLPGLTTEAYEDNDTTPVLQDGARVYAGVHRKDEFIIGDAYGYISAFGNDGKPRWQHFIGSSVGDLALSEDESTLICTTYAGFISILKLDNGHSENYEIGTGGHTEIRRWIFWKNQKTPLAW